MTIANKCSIIIFVKGTNVCFYRKHSFVFAKTKQGGELMNSTEKQLILDEYCSDELKKLKQLCNPMLMKIGGISNSDYDDFYDIALETLADSIVKYDNSKSCHFKTFLKGNIERRFKNELRDRNRDKRIPLKQIESIDYVCEDGTLLCELIPSDFDVYREAFGEDLSDTKINIYLNKLSFLQRRIVNMLSDGHTSSEIKAALNLNARTYSDNLSAIQAYENIKILL